MRKSLSNIQTGVYIINLVLETHNTLTEISRLRITLAALKKKICCFIQRSSFWVILLMFQYPSFKVHNFLEDLIFADD